MVSKILFLVALVSLFIYSNQLAMCSGAIGRWTLSDDISEFEALQDEIEDIDGENVVTQGFFSKISAFKYLQKQPTDSCFIGCKELSSSCARLHPRTKEKQIDPTLYLMLGKPALESCKNGTNVCGTCNAIQPFGLKYFGSDKFALFLRFLKERVCELNCGVTMGVQVTNSTFEKGITSSWNGMEQYEGSGKGIFRLISHIKNAKQIKEEKEKWDSDSKMYSLLLSNLWQNLFSRDRTEIMKKLAAFVASIKQKLGGFLLKAAQQR
jgi:hypothetical protein